jgi:hypothetical protein
VKIPKKNSAMKWTLLKRCILKKNSVFIKDKLLSELTREEFVREKEKTGRGCRRTGSELEVGSGTEVSDLLTSDGDEDMTEVVGVDWKGRRRGIGCRI